MLDNSSCEILELHIVFPPLDIEELDLDPVPPLDAARRYAGHLVKIEVEVDTLEQLDELLRHKADVVLLDNMSPAQLKVAVDRVAGRLLTEASGGVNLDTVRAIAESGVDLISVGALTHSAPVFDLGLDFVG